MKAKFVTVTMLIASLCGSEAAHANGSTDPTASSPSPGSANAALVSRDGTWTREDENEVKRLIAEAMDHNDDDVEEAFAELRDRRQRPENYYDMNLAIAADYLRARWETQKCGRYAASLQVEIYLALKRTTGVPREGPGPVSPYSDLEAKYMRKGVEDEVATMSLLERSWWESPAGRAYGLACATFGVLTGEEEG